MNKMKWEPGLWAQERRNGESKVLPFLPCWTKTKTEPSAVSSILFQTIKRSVLPRPPTSMSEMDIYLFLPWKTHTTLIIRKLETVCGSLKSHFTISHCQTLPNSTSQTTSPQGTYVALLLSMAASINRRNVVIHVDLNFS